MQEHAPEAIFRELELLPGRLITLPAISKRRIFQIHHKELFHRFGKITVKFIRPQS